MFKGSYSKGKTSLSDVIEEPLALIPSVGEGEDFYICKRL